MATLPAKLRHSEKFVNTKYEALQQLEKGVSSNEVAAQFRVLKDTLSTWKKNKVKIMESFQSYLQGNKRRGPETYKSLNRTLMKWLLNLRSQNIPTNGPLLKEKANDLPLK
ncbi:tigger transposable element-derived protein 4-like [Hydractinia symbiolongicarpus]|uniref:tigger transposable element-derived protein 4-like n=1 Tax=Hydractinia symbiolongicarpus TaxID=13093 RepID=UPI00254AA5CC|nr:tigger transposable element-derived protein 4-like [Hydractinia symbiolongicarpus]